jgi:LacI family transcriptional regulator
VSSAAPRHPTLKDVARQAGVSVTTVHIALTERRDGVRVPEETRARVRRIAEELGYRPNILARNLKTRRTSTIGFVSDQVTTTPFAVAMLGAAQDEAARRGYLLVVNVGEQASPSVQRQAVDLLLQQRVEGMIYACMYHQVVVPPPGLPPTTVLLNAADADQTYRGIVPDDRQGGQDAVAHLVEAGHRRIAFLDDQANVVAAGLRHRGYIDALAEAGIDPDPRWRVGAASNVRGGLEVDRFLDLPSESRPTAIFCFNDRQAMGAYRVARRRGLKIPDDLSMVGFDDQEYLASELDPPLTTVRQPHEEMGRRAVRLLLGELEPGERDADDRTVRVHCPLVRRESVAAPPALIRPSALIMQARSIT